MHVVAGVQLPKIECDRDEQWLVGMLDEIWERYFADTPRVNKVRVSYGCTWKSRLGLITMSEDGRTTYIQVNALLSHPDIPEFVTLITIAHEMVHYAHGFGSPLPQRYKHPHRGGIVKRELVRRGLAREYELYDEWVYENWYDFYAAYEASSPDESRSAEPETTSRHAAK